MSARVLAEVSDYDGLVTALRARAAERNLALSSIAFAQVAGLPDRYVAKVLAPCDTPAASKRHLGRISLGPVLALLGVKLPILEDTVS